jgi:hypothetical protein
MAEITQIPNLKLLGQITQRTERKDNPCPIIEPLVCLKALLEQPFAPFILSLEASNTA